MILLKATTESLQILTTTTAGIDYSVSYADITTTAFTPSTNEGKIVTGTTTSVLAAPAAATQRQVKLITISNIHASASNTVVVQKLITATAYNLTPVITLLAGETMQYMDGQGWIYYSATGAIKGNQTAAGSTTQIQFNSGNSVLTGDPDFTWDNSINTLTLGGPDTGIVMEAITNEPAASATNTLRLYSKNISGRMLPKWTGPTGLDTVFQPALFGNNITIWNPTNATAGLWSGTIGTTTSAGTFTAAAPTNTNIYTAQTRARYANIVTTTNQILGIRLSATPTYFLGNATDQGGFFFFARIGFDVWTNGGRMFVGLTANTGGTTVSADPSATNNSVGFAVDAADNGAISFLMRNASAATKTPTGMTIVSNKGYDLLMFAASNSTTVSYKITDVVAGTSATGTVSTNAPVVNTLLLPNVLASNAALTTVTAIQMGINRLYIETDY